MIDPTLPTAHLNALTMVYTVLWVVMIPLGLVLVAVLIRLFLLLNDVGDFVSHARYELYPVLKDARHLTSRIERLTQRAEDYMDSLEAGASKTGRYLGEQFGRLTSLAKPASLGLGSALGIVLKTMFKK